MADRKLKLRKMSLEINHAEIFEVMFSFCFLISPQCMYKQPTKEKIKSFAKKLFNKAFTRYEKLYLLYMSENIQLHQIAKEASRTLYREFEIIKLKGVPQWDEEKKKHAEAKDE
ncbi:MAG: hypothetical protein AB1394_07475 [Bacteroidota bacterium]